MEYTLTEADDLPDSSGSLRSKCGSVVNSKLFQNSIITLIVVNSIMMGVATYDFVTDYPKRQRAFEAFDLIFLIIFTLELALQFVYHGIGLFKSGWLTFDFIVIALSWMFPSLQVVRAFRCLRLTTRVKLLRNVVDALLFVVPKLAAISLLLLLIFYIYAVIFTSYFKEMYSDGQTTFDYFGSLDKTFFTLFQLMTGAGWPDIAREVMEIYSWSWWLFVSFIFISAFTVIQLVIAVLCEAIAEIEKKEREHLEHVHEESLERKIDALAKQVEMLVQQSKQMA